MGSVLISLIIPVLDFQWTGLVQEEPPIVQYLMPITIGVEELETIIITASSEEHSFDWMSILTGIYWFGVLVALGRFLYGLSKINKLYKNGKSQPLKIIDI